jgi:hypothetical protein
MKHRLQAQLDDVWALYESKAQSRCVGRKKLQVITCRRGFQRSFDPTGAFGSTQKQTLVGLTAETKELRDGARAVPSRREAGRGA